MIGAIYKITHLPSGKSYIGATVETVERRFSKHLYSKRFRDIPKAELTCETLHLTSSMKTLQELEASYIKIFKSNVRACGFNRHIPKTPRSDRPPQFKLDIQLEPEELALLKKVHARDKVVFPTLPQFIRYLIRQEIK